MDITVHITLLPMFGTGQPLSEQEHIDSHELVLPKSKICIIWFDSSSRFVQDKIADSFSAGYNI